MEDIAQECYKYMSTDAGKDKLSNHPGRTPISKEDWSKKDFEKEEKVDSYVENYLQISESRDTVLANQEVLKNLAMQINAIEEAVTGLTKSLKT